MDNCETNTLCTKLWQWASSLTVKGEQSGLINLSWNSAHNELLSLMSYYLSWVSLNNDNRCLTNCGITGKLGVLFVILENYKYISENTYLSICGCSGADILLSWQVVQGSPSINDQSVVSQRRIPRSNKLCIIQHYNLYFIYSYYIHILFKYDQPLV